MESLHFFRCKQLLTFCAERMDVPHPQIYIRRKMAKYHLSDDSASVLSRCSVAATGSAPPIFWARGCQYVSFSFTVLCIPEKFWSRLEYTVTVLRQWPLALLYVSSNGRQLLNFQSTSRPLRKTPSTAPTGNWARQMTPFSVPWPPTPTLFTDNWWFSHIWMQIVWPLPADYLNADILRKM